MYSEDSVHTLIELLRRKHITFADGLGDLDIEAVENKFGFLFPPDLRALLQCALPISEQFPNWRDADDTTLRALLDWPVEGICFDVEHAGFWLEEWGSRPDALVDALAVAKQEVHKTPTLIPVFSHRFIPSEPHMIGNPVFSVYQTNIIYYGANLADYFRNEFAGEERRLPEYADVRQVRFWNRFAESNPLQDAEHPFTEIIRET